MSAPDWQQTNVATMAGMDPRRRSNPSSSLISGDHRLESSSLPQSIAHSGNHGSQRGEGTHKWSNDPRTRELSNPNHLLTSLPPSMVLHENGLGTDLRRERSALPQDELIEQDKYMDSSPILADTPLSLEDKAVLLCQPTQSTWDDAHNNTHLIHSNTSSADYIYIDEVEWADPNDSNNPVEKAIRPKYTPSDGPCGCTRDSSTTICCLDTSCVLFACQEECRSDCLAGDLCGNKRITQKKWKQLQVIDAGMKGKGLQALENIQASDFIIEYCGVAVQKKYLESVFKRYRTERMLYIMALDGDIFIDARTKGSVARFINHSCEPNCAVHRWKVRGVNRAAVFALRDISAGEELTFDYKWERKRGRAPTKCHCNTPDCRGTLEMPRDEDDEASDIDLNGHWMVPQTDHIFKEDLIDKIIKVFLPDEQEFYLADVCKYDPETGKHCLMYRGDVNECWEDLRSAQWMMLDEQMKEFVISRKTKNLSSSNSPLKNSYYLLDSSPSTSEKECCIYLSESLKNKLGTFLRRCQDHHRVQITMISVTELDSTIDLFAEHSQETSTEPCWKFIISGKSPALAKDYLEQNIRTIILKNESETSAASISTTGGHASILSQEIIVPRCIFDSLKSQLPRLKLSLKNVEMAFTHSESKAKYFAKLKLTGIKTNVQYALIAVWREALSICKIVQAPCLSSGHYKDFAFYAGTLTDLEYQQLFIPKRLHPVEESFDIRDSLFLKTFEEKYRCTVWTQPRSDMVMFNSVNNDFANASEPTDLLKIYFGCDPKRIEELWNTLKTRVVSDINQGVEYLDLGQDIVCLSFLSETDRKVTFFRFVDHVAGVHVCVDPFTKSLIRISPSSSNHTKGCRLARELISLQIELLHDYQAHHQRWLFGREWRVSTDVLSIKPDFPAKNRLISNSCREISSIVSVLNLNSVIAAHACIIFYRFIRQAGVELLNKATQTKMRELLIVCIYLANKCQKICRWKRLHAILQASFTIFYGESSKDLNNAAVWEKRVLATENELLSTIQLDLFWVGMDGIYSACILEGRISEPLVANVMDITLSGPILAVGPQLWLDLGPEYAFTAVAALLSIHIDPLFDTLCLVPHKFVAAVDLIVSSYQTFQGSNSKDSKQSQDLFGGVKSIRASREVIVENLRNRLPGRISVRDVVMRRTIVAEEFYLRKAFRVVDVKLAREVIVPIISRVRTDSSCDILFEYPKGCDDAIDFILEGSWRSISLAEYYLFTCDGNGITVVDVSEIYANPPDYLHITSDRIKSCPGITDSTFLSKANMANPVWTGGDRNISSTMTGNVHQVANNVLIDASLRWWTSGITTADHGSLTSLLHVTSFDRCNVESAIDELATIADAVCTEKSPRSRSYPMLNMYTSLGAGTINSFNQEKERNYTSVSLKRWPPAKVEIKESTKNNGDVGFSPAALQEMQLLHQIHLLVPSPRGHPNFVLPLSIAFSGVLSKKERNLHEANVVSRSESLNEHFLTPANKGIPDETPLANGNYLIFSPVPFTLQAVLTLRKRKNEALPVVEVTPLIIQLWFRDLLSALCHCHANHVVLRTLHPNQIYIDNSGTAKIGSLYRCHVLHPEERSRSVDGTKNNKAKKGDKEAIDAGDIRSNSYLAPELLFGSSRYTQQSDIWALGCMMAHVILDKVLFHGKDRGSVLHAMFKIIGTPSTDHSKTFENYPHFKSTVESSKMKKYKKNVAKAFRSMMTERSLDTKDYEGLFRLLELMLDLDPDKRISASAALEHESMQNLSSSRTVRNRFVHDWTSFKNQYDLCLKHITSSGANDLDGFYSDDEDNRIDGYKTNSISKEKKVPMALEPLEYFDIDEIMNKSLTPSVPKRVRYSSDGAH